jgi:hypothetical protein
LRFHPTG